MEGTGDGAAVLVEILLRVDVLVLYAVRVGAAAGFTAVICLRYKTNNVARRNIPTYTT